MTSTGIGTLAENQVVFPKLGLEFYINDTAFTVFGIEIKWYGLLITIGLLLAMIYGFSQMKKYGIDPDRAIDAVIAGVIGAIIGARAYYVIMEWDTYAGNWKDIFNLRNGGLAVYGGIIGALLFGGIVAKLRKVRFLPLIDIVAIGLLLGQGIGRWGNFTNQEAFGYNTDSVFGMSSGKIQDWIMYNVNLGQNADIVSMKWEEAVHPCFLYESVWCLLGFALFALFAKRIRRFDGQIFLMYLVWYGAERAFVEGLRTDSLYIGQLRISQALSIILAVGAFIALIVLYSKVRRMGDEYVLYVDSEESKELLRQAERREAKDSEAKNILSEDDEKDSEKEITESSESPEETDSAEPQKNDDTINDDEETESVEMEEN